MMRTPVPLVVAALVLARAGSASAADAKDASHGRIDGDLSASLGAGAAFGPRGPRAALDVRFRYLWTAGVFATYEDGPFFGSGAEPKRTFASGIEIRPLFLARWLTGRESGQPYLDLTMDSFGLELGAVFMQPEGASFGSRPGLQAGVGMQVPILPRASGPLIGIHAGARWSDSALAGHPILGASDRSMYLLLTVAWQQVFGGHVVDLGDPEPR